MLPYAMIGGSLFLSYQLIIDYLKHHETNTDIPQYFYHTFALTVVGAGIGLFYGAMPRHLLIGGFMGGMFVAPASYFLMKTARFNANARNPNIFYENEVSQEDVDRIRHIDMIEALSHQMRARPGYGYHQKDQRHV